MINYVKINGVSSQTITGLAINELPPITKPEMRTTKEEIDGRDGDIITKLGYSAYDKTITIGLWGTAYDVNEVIKFFNKEGTIVFSNEADKYYNFTMINSIDIERLLKFKTASITFHCQPFKYPLSETPLEIEYDYIEDEDETLTLNNTGNATMKLDLKGNTSQSGTPTPTSPIPVSVVSGDNDVVVCGKNILDKSVFVVGSCSYGDVGQSANYNGGATNRFTIKKENAIPVRPNTTYTFNSTYNQDYALAQLDSSKLNLGDTGWKASNTLPYTFTTGATAQYITFNFKKDSATTIDTIKGYDYQIEQSSPASTYAPYTSQTYEVDLPVENIATSYRSSGSGYYNYNYDNSKVSKTMTLSFMPNFSATNTTIYARPIISGTLYTLGTIATITSGKKASLTFTLTDAQISEIKATTGGFFQIYDPDVVFTENYVSEFQLEAGSKANSFTPYGTTPIELCKIGEYQDYFTKNSDGEWCKYNAIGKVVLDGSENWQYYSNLFYVDSVINDYLKVNETTSISKYYKGATNASTTSAAYNNGNNTMSFRIGDAINRILIRDDRYTLTGDFRTWLYANNVPLYYVLATPYLSLIEDNNLIEQLDNIQNAMSYEGTTNIGQVNNDKPFIISAKALEDGTNEVVVNNIGNVYSKPLIALEGSGNVDIYLDNTQILKANVESKMNIDIAQLEAYNPDTMTLLNRQVIGNYNSMTLQPGNNTIRIDGSLDKATITNYTRWL